MLTSAFMALALWSGDPAPDSPWVISVESWVRPVEIYIPGPSEVFVLVFGVNRETVPKQEWIERFVECTTPASIQAMALCDQPVDAVRKASSGWPERLSVGAGVRSPKLKPPGSLPQILYYSESTGIRWMPADDETLRWICQSGIRSRTGEGVAADFDAASQAADPEIESLVRLVQDRSEDVNARIRALRTLRGRMSPERLLVMCDELLLERPGEVATDMQMRAWWRGEIAYERHLADPDVRDKQPELSVWQRAFAANLRHGDKSALWPVAVYESAAPLKPFARLQLDYFEHQGDEPDEVLIRDVIIQQIARRASPSQAKTVLLQWLPLETDRTLAGSIASLTLDKKLYRDREVLSALRDRGARETDVRLRAYLEELVSESEIRAAAE